VWLAVAPIDMRAGTDAALARVVGVFGAARPHHALWARERDRSRLLGLNRAGEVARFVALRPFFFGNAPAISICGRRRCLTRVRYGCGRSRLLAAAIRVLAPC
jgi:transposase